MSVLETDRLRLVRLAAEHAHFMLALLNDADFLRNIGDRGVRTLAEAQRYIRRGPCASYRRHGFGLWLVERACDGEALGICGLLRRDTLADVDLGFAFAAAHRRQGYALESARGVMAYARGALALGRVVAIVKPDNEASVKLLTRLGFAFERMLPATDDKPSLCLYASPPRQ